MAGGVKCTSLHQGKWLDKNFKRDMLDTSCTKTYQNKCTPLLMTVARSPIIFAVGLLTLCPLYLVPQSYECIGISFVWIFIHHWMHIPLFLCFFLEHELSTILIFIGFWFSSPCLFHPISFNSSASGSAFPAFFSLVPHSIQTIFSFNAVLPSPSKFPLQLVPSLLQLSASSLSVQSQRCRQSC